MDMNGPALAPPPGVIPNLDNPDNKNGLAWAVLVLCCVISTLCVLLRGYGKVYLLKKFGMQEGLIICAYGIFCSCCWASFSMIHQPGYFVHQWDVRLGAIIPMTYLVYVMGNTYVIVLMLLKVAMLAEWCQILVPRQSRSKNIFWWSCIAMIATQVLACVAIIIAMNLRCIPLEMNWDFTILGTCSFPLYTVQLCSGIIYLATDIIMFFMPHHLIWNLQMSRTKRLGVSGIFGLGLLACVAAALRLHVTIMGGSNPDVTYNLGDLIFWAMAEMTCGFFVVCVPCIPKIMQDMGIIRGLKRRLGMSTGPTTPAQRGYIGNSMGSTAGRKQPSTKTSNAYDELDDDNVPLEDVNGSESTEYLRKEKLTGSAGIVRTTHVTIKDSPDARNHSGGE